MATDQQMLSLFEEIENFLRSKIEKCKCLLIVGARNSGKTCLIKYFSGVTFTRETNEQDLPFLVENNEVVPDNQVDFFNSEKLLIELAVLRVNEGNSEEEVTIIEMPSLTSLSQQSEADNETSVKGIIFSIYIWNMVLSLAKQIHICLINPYEFITDDHKLVQFFSVWQQIVSKNQAARDQIRKAVSIIFTKPEYEDDKQSLLTSLEHLSQAGNQGITDNNTFSDATAENRVFCFLSQDTEEGQGQELLNSIINDAIYYYSAEDNIFQPSWTQIFLWHFIKDFSSEKFKGFFDSLELLLKMLYESQAYCDNIFAKSMSCMGLATALSFFRSLPKQSGLEKKEEAIYSSLKSRMKSQPDPVLQALTKIQETRSQVANHLELLHNVNSLIQKPLSLPEELQDRLLGYYQTTFQLSEVQSKILSNWFDEKFALWKLPAAVGRLCQKHKENHELQVALHQMEDLSVTALKKFVSLLKAKMINGIKHYEIFSTISQEKVLSQHPLFKQLCLGLGLGEGEGDELIIEEEDSQTSSDCRIKRLYYKAEDSTDLYSQIKQKSKKVIIKTSVKAEQINERQNIKNLLSSIQRDQESRNQNLELLAIKLSEFRFYQHAMETYMDLGDGSKLYTFLTQRYLPYLDEQQQESPLKFLRDILIPYLGEKAAIYSDVESATYFLYSSQCCYDYLSARLGQSDEQYKSVLELSNQIETPNEERKLDSEDYRNYQTGVNNQSNDVKFLKFATFSKAEAIHNIYERDQKCKKNIAALTQIRKYLEASQSQGKVK